MHTISISGSPQALECFYKPPPHYLHHQERGTLSGVGSGVGGGFDGATLLSPERDGLPPTVGGNPTTTRTQDI